MNYSSEIEKQEVSEHVEKFLSNRGFTISGKDDQRPWGGFFEIQREQTSDFIAAFFPDLKPDVDTDYSKLSPKILMVAPGKRLSWQYHHRRAEIWTVLSGPAGVIISDTDEQGDLHVLETGSMIEIGCGQRHRLVGLEKNWGIIAEIWKHTEDAYPSDEQDIIRLADDFGRKE